MHQQPEGERYTDGGVTEITGVMASRSAEEHLAFFLPHLRRGMRLLHCGCGPGAISVDLAETIAPGELVGIDNDPHQVELAQAHAAERGVANARFEVADVYELPFPDG